MTATITDSRHAQHEQTAINNAIANIQPSPYTCKEEDLLKAMRQLAENGVHLQSYELRIKVDNAMVNGVVTDGN